MKMLSIVAAAAAALSISAAAHAEEFKSLGASPAQALASTEAAVVRASSFVDHGTIIASFDSAIQPNYDFGDASNQERLMWFGYPNGVRMFVDYSAPQTTIYR